MLKKLNTFLIILLVASLVTSSIYLYLEHKKDKKQEDIFEELSNVVVEDSEEQQGDSEQEERKIDIVKLYNKNPDFIGWIKINGTNIDYPVMQTEKERADYYLRRNFYKEYSYYGTPYLAEFCNVLKSDNLIVYGHHINGSKMFGELEKYKSKKFYDEHKIINFNTIYGDYDYEIIAVFKTIAYKGFKYYEFEKAQTKEEYSSFINKCKDLSFYETGEKAQYGDKLITLSTCEYSNKNGRFVVVAKRILE